MSYLTAGDLFGALIYIVVFGGVCAVILKVRRHNPLLGIPLGILGPFGILIAIAIALIPSRAQDDDDDQGGYAR